MSSADQTAQRGDQADVQIQDHCDIAFRLRRYWGSRLNAEPTIHIRGDRSARVECAGQTIELTREEQEVCNV